MHAPREFEGADYRVEFIIARAALGLLSVQRAQQLKLFPLVLRVHPRRGDVLDGGILGRNPRTANCCALISRWQEGVAVVARAAIAHRGTDADEARQIFILRAQPVIYPRAHARANEIDGTRMHEERARPVRHALGVHAFEDAKIVRVLGHMREELAHRLATLAVVFKLPERLHDLVFHDLARLGQCPRVIKPNHLAVIIEELLLVIKRIHL